MNRQRKIVYHSPEEDAEITAAAMSDPDALPMTDEEFARVKPVFLSGMPKEMFPNFYVERDVIEAFEKTGDGWESRINTVIRDYANTHGLFEELLRRQPGYVAQETYIELSDEKRELGPEAWGDEDGMRVTNFRIDLDVEDAFLTGGKGWAARIHAVLREYAIEHGLLESK